MIIPGDSTTAQVRPSLVGRVEEIEHLSSLLGEALAGHGRTVLVSGPAGVGKSRLVEELMAIATQAGCDVTSGRCIPGIPRPLFPFEEALLGLERIKKGASGAHGRAGYHQSAASEDVPMARFSLEQNMFLLLDRLRTVSEIKPVLMCLDDLQWVDSVSAQALHFISRNLEGTRIMIVGTFRPEDLSSAPGEMHPLDENLRIMRREKVCDVIDLAALGPDDTLRLISGMLNARVDPRLAKVIHQESEGNPLFIVEIIRLLVLKDVLVMGPSGLQMEADADMGIPSTIREVMLHRLEGLSPEERRIIESASVMGMELDHELLADTLSMGKEDLWATLGAIEADRHLLRSSDGRYWFDHDKLRQVAYGCISQPRRRELHRLTGLSIERRGVTEESVGPLAYHFTQAGVEDKCVDYSLQAGTLCLHRYANREAISFMETIRSISARTGSYLRQRHEAMEGLGDAFFELGEHERSYSFFEECLKAASSDTDRGRLLRKSAECWWPTRLGKGSTVKMNGLMDLAQSLDGLHPYDLGEILSNRAIFACWDGRFDLAEGLSDRAEELFKGISSQDRQLLEMINHVDFFLTLGRMDEARQKMAEVHGLLTGRHPRIEMEAARVNGMCLMCAGEIDAAVMAFSKVKALASRYDDLVLSTWGSVFTAFMLEAAGRYAQALKEAETGLEQAYASGSSFMIATSSALASICRRRSGDHASSNNALDTALKHLQEVKWSLTTFMHGMVNLAMAEKCRSDGDAGEAHKRYGSALDAFAATYEHLLFEGYGYLWYGQTLLMLGEEEEGRGHLSHAIRLFDKLGNTSMIRTTELLLEESNLAQRIAVSHHN